jgi:nucleotide-binding universal stress UspA family protein
MSEEISYRKVLVPIDGSPKSINAFKYAVKFAKNFPNCEVHILYVIDEENIKKLSANEDQSYSGLSRKFRQQGENYINKAKQEIKYLDFNHSLIKEKMLKGDPVQEIINYSVNFDLIIMSVRGKKHVVDIMMGHVTERVINLSEIPVLIIS